MRRRLLQSPAASDGSYYSARQWWPTAWISIAIARQIVTFRRKGKPLGHTHAPDAFNWLNAIDARATRHLFLVNGEMYAERPLRLSVEWKVRDERARPREIAQITRSYGSDIAGVDIEGVGREGSCAEGEPGQRRQSAKGVRQGRCGKGHNGKFPRATRR